MNIRERLKKQIKTSLVCDDIPFIDYQYVGISKGKLCEIISDKVADAIFSEFEVKEKGICVWTWDTDGFFQTSCGNGFEFTTGNPGNNNYQFCPYCGKQIKERV